MLSLCTAIITYALLCSYLSFRADNTNALAQHNVDPKIEFESPYWNPIFDHAKSFIRHLATLYPLYCPTIQEAFRDPWLTTTTMVPFPCRRCLPHPQTKLDS